jgi:Thioredoxin-like [2Fe-2S] ferredoxin
MSFLPGFLPGLGLVKGMATTLRRFFEPKATIRYPEVRPEGSPKFRGRLQLLYDEYGTLKCETCFQCAQACPIECIDMGGVDTRGRYHVHWGPPETYGERRDESALRRSGRPVPDQAYEHFGGIDLAPVDAILDEHDYDPKKLLPILEGVQAAYGYLPVGAIKHVSFRTGAWYAFIYGTASYYRHLRFVPPADRIGSVAFAGARPSERHYVDVLAAALGGQPAADRSGDAGEETKAAPDSSNSRRGRGGRKVH